MSLRQDDLHELLQACAELRARLRAGETTRVEDVLGSHPSLASNDEAVLELIHVEVVTRNDLGQNLTLKEWQERFPRLLPRMETIVSLRGVFGSEMPTLSDSTAGQENPLVSVQGPGSRLPRIGNYQLLQEIGRGGMGVVYKARQTSLSRIVALKMILAGEHAGMRERARLRNEAEAAAQLLHSNVVQIFEIGEHEGLPFLAMEYVPGGNLTRMLRGMPQAFRWSARLTETLARAIHVAHRRGIVHRDLNPSNILIAQDGTPKITDFGLAKFLVNDQGLSLNGVMLGTPSYMAPEQVSSNGKSVGPTTDVYALAALLYEMLTGTAPYRGFTPMETLCQVMEAELVPPSRLRHGVPEDLETICLKCLDRDPARRYGTAEELAEDLQRFNESQPIRARRTSRIRQAMQWTRRQPQVASLLGLSLLLFLTLLGVVGGYSLYMTEKNNELERRSSQEIKLRNEMLIERQRSRDKASTDRRNSYDGLLNQVKQSIEAGQLELARERFEHLKGIVGKEDPLGFEWYYLDGVLKRTGWLLEGHDETVSCLAVSRQGGTAVSGDVSGRVLAWDIASRTPRLCQGGHDTPVQRVALASDSQGHPKSLASVSAQPDDSLDVRLWDPGTGSLITSLRTGPLQVTDLQFAPDGDRLTVCGLAPDGTTSRAFTWHRGPAGWPLEPMASILGITRQVYSPDGNVLAQGAGDGTVSLLGMHGPSPAPLEQRPGGKVLSLAFTPDGTRLAASRQDRSLTVWDLASGRVLAHHLDQDGPVLFLDFCLDGQTLVGCEAPGILWTRHPSASGPRRFLPGVKGPLDVVSLSPDGRLLAAGGPNQPATVWNLAPGTRGPSYQANNRIVRQIAFSPDSRSLVLGYGDDIIRVWRFFEAPESRRELAGHAKEVLTLGFSPDGKLLASGSGDHTIKLWDVETGRELLTLNGHDQSVTSLAFFAESNRLASVSLDGKVLAWNLTRDGQQSSQISARPTLVQAYDDQLLAVTISSDEEQLAAAGTKGPIHVWNLAGNHPRPPLEGHGSIVSSLVFSPNPGYLASASGDGTVRLWDPKTGLLKTLDDFHGVTRALAFSSDGLLLAGGGDSNIATLWSMDAGAVASTIKGHPLPIRAVAFSANQKTVATGCDDGWVRLWDTVTGQLFFALQGATSRVNAVAFSPDRKTLASCDQKGRIHLWCTDDPARSDARAAP